MKLWLIFTSTAFPHGYYPFYVLPAILMSAWGYGVLRIWAKGVDEVKREPLLLRYHHYVRLGDYPTRADALALFFFALCPFINLIALIVCGAPTICAGTCELYERSRLSAILGKPLRSF